MEKIKTKEKWEYCFGKEINLENILEFYCWKNLHHNSNVNIHMLYT